MPLHPLPCRKSYPSPFWCVVLGSTSLSLAYCQSQREGDGTRQIVADRQSASSAPDYIAEEELVYAQVLAQLLQQTYWTDLQSLRSTEGAPLLPPPPPGTTTQAQRWAYFQTYANSHALLQDDPFVLNLAPELRSLPDFLAENGGFLADTAHPAYTHALQALQRRTPVFTRLTTRAYRPSSPPPVWRYTLYWRYEPFRQYAEPTGSAGRQRGLQLSRICFNAARDSAFFVYDVDYQQYALGGVGLVSKRHGRWTLQEPR
jgi:hypothetical protein